MGARTRLGRAPHNRVVVADERVSGEHASLFYLEGQFWVRDLASRNGTWVDGALIPTGRNIPLPEGSRIAVGRTSNQFRLVDATAPGPSALEMRDGTRIFGAADTLWISSGEGASLAVVAEEGGWFLESNRGRRPVQDGEVILAGERSVQLELPDLETTQELVAETCQASSSGDLSFTFSTSQDEESVSLVVRAQGAEFDLGERTHHYLLLLLARARHDDSERGELSDGEQGWVSTGDLAKMLATTPENMNHQFYRLRQQLKRVEFPEDVQILERRTASREVRLASGSIAID